MKISVITSIYGGFDKIPPVPQGFDEAILVSDVPIESEWTNLLHPLPLPHRLAAKIPKFRPDIFTNNLMSVWMDASCNDPTGWLANTAKEVITSNQLSAFLHPERQCIYEEASCCIDWPKYRKWPIDIQIKKYKSEGYPENNGLWACGVLMRKHTKEIKELGNQWLIENTMYSIQDQISFPYLLWKNGIECHQLSGNIWKSDLVFHNHKIKEEDYFMRKILNKILKL